MYAALLTTRDFFGLAVLVPAPQLLLKRIDCAERHFSGRIDIGDARLKLQKVLPCTFFVCFGVWYVAHTKQ
jgi:hypothetical protein